MKIHDLNNGNNHTGVNRRKQTAALQKGFGQVMEECRNGRRHISAEGIKGLARDCLSLPAQIKQEIDILCECETGENIDMARLDELLKLYREI